MNLTENGVIRKEYIRFHTVDNNYLYKDKGCIK